MAYRNTAQIAGISVAVVATGIIGYVAYFDHMRRNNPDFRKGIRKQHKKVQAAAEARSKAEKDRNSKALRDVLKEIQSESPPTRPEQQEAFFQEQVAEGEKLAAMGPEMHVQAASHFYRALRVYPSPVELLMIYQKVCPAPVFALLLELTSLTGGAGGIGVPPQPGASVIDIDDSSPVAGSPNGKSSGTGSGMGSGGEWERVSDEGRRA